MTALNWAKTGKANRLAVLTVFLMSSASPVALAQQLASVETEVEAETQVGQQAAAGASDPNVEQFLVTGTVRFRERESDTALKLTLPVKDLPQSVTTITRDIIDFANIRKFDDVYRVDASASSSNRIDEFPTGFYRGFSTEGTNALRLDGFRFIGNIDLDIAMFERFEIVKGPTSAIYGQNTIGGSLNAVFKSPTDEPGGYASLSYGTFDRFQAEGDYSFHLNSDETISARFVASYQNTDSHIEDIDAEDLTLFAAFRFRPTEETDINLKLSYQDSDGGVHFGSGLQANRDGTIQIPDVPRDFLFGQEYAEFDRDAFLAFLDINQQLNENWRVRVAAQYAKNNRNNNSAAVFSWIDEDGNTTGSGAYAADSTQELYGGEVNLIGDFEAFGQEHTLFLGADWAISNDRFDAFGFSYLDFGSNLGGFIYTPGMGNSFNIFDSPRDRAAPGFDDFYYLGAFDTRNRFAGITAQLLLRPTDKLTVLLAGRYSFDRLRQRFAGISEVGDVPAPEDFFVAEVETDKFVPQIGVTYAVTENINVYGSWGRTYEPNTDLQEDPNDPGGDGIPLPAEEGEQFEIGIKGEFLDERLLLTAALFDLERSNISVPDISNPNFAVPLGSQKSRGIEVGAFGQVTDNWSIYFSGTYLDAEFTEGELDGLRPANAAEWAFSIFTNYEFLEGPLTGLSLGAGHVFKDMHEVSSSSGGSEFTGANLPSVVTFDFGTLNETYLNMTYKKDGWQADFSIENLFDTTFYAPIENSLSFGIHVNPGRQFNFRLLRRF